MLDDALEEKPGGEKVRIGMVVIRGNAVVMLEARNSPSIDLETRTRRLILCHRHSIGSTQTNIKEVDEMDLGSTPCDEKETYYSLETSQGWQELALRTLAFG